MKRFFFWMVVLFCFFSCSSMDLDIYTPKKDVASMESYLQPWLDTLCSKTFQGRKTASVGDSLTFVFLANQLEAFGYDYTTQNFQTTSGYRLRNILVTVKGKNDSVIVVGAHYDGPIQSTGANHYPAANDNASGVLVLLGFLDSLKLSGIKPDYTLKCCLWDGEEVFDGSCFWGSRYFVSQLKNKSSVKCYLNFDSVGHEHDLYIRHKGYSLVPDIIQKLYSNDRFTYQDVDMNERSDGGSDYVSFSNMGISYISFSDHNGNMCEYNSHSVNDLPKAISLGRIKRHIDNLVDIINL